MWHWILNLLHSFPFIPGLFSANSSNETLDESEYNSTEYQYHNNVFNDSDFEYDLFWNINPKRLLKGINKLNRIKFGMQ